MEIPVEVWTQQDLAIGEEATYDERKWNTFCVFACLWMGLTREQTLCHEVGAKLADARTGRGVSHDRSLISRAAWARLVGRS